MKVVTVACAKGGSTKTTVAATLASRAIRESARVALFDLNADQGNLSQWWILRGSPLNPQLVDVENIERDVERLRAQGFEWLIIDTPPLDLDVIEAAIMQSDVVIVPIRCSLFDLGAVTPVVEMCHAHSKRFQFLLSAVDSRMSRLTQQTMGALVTQGPIFATRMSYRQSNIQAVAIGRAGFEVDRELTQEVDNLWVETKRFATAAPLFSAERRAANG
jgi:cellulose biosynthesis protein BcsQ